MRTPLATGMLLVAAGLAPTGCVETEPEVVDENAGAEVCDALPIFAERCAGAACHGSGDGTPPTGGVDLLAPGVAERLVDVPASYPGLGCAPDTPALLLDTVDPSSSLMWAKLTNTQECGEGMPVPYQGAALPEDELKCVISWMQAAVLGHDGGTPVGTGGAAGTGGNSGSGGNAASGGDAGAGGDRAAGGDTGAGGDRGAGGAMGMGTGGMMPGVASIVIEAECAHGEGCAGGITGFNTGVSLLQDDGTTVGYIGSAVTLAYENIETAGQDQITFNYAKGNEGGSVEVRLGSDTGEVLATFTPESTGDWFLWTTATETLNPPLTGEQTIVLTFVSEADVFNLDWIELSSSAGL